MFSVCTMLILAEKFILGLSEDSTKVDVPPILNGTAAKTGQFPFMVSISEIAHFYSCAGALITSRNVLTSASCYVNFTIGCNDCPLGYCFAGDVFIEQNNKTSKSRQRRNIVKYNTHPKYKAFDIQNALTILTIDTPFSLSKDVAAIPLAFHDLKNNESCVSLGFSLKNHGYAEPRPADLIWYRTTVFEKDCNGSGTSCVVHPRRSIYVAECGGPLIGSITEPDLFGLLVYTQSDHMQRISDVYTSVFANRDWIIKNSEWDKRSSVGGAERERNFPVMIFCAMQLLYSLC